MGVSAQVAVVFGAKLCFERDSNDNREDQTPSSCRHYNHKDCAKNPHAIQFKLGSTSLTLFGNKRKNVCAQFMLDICKFSDARIIIPTPIAHFLLKDGGRNQNYGRREAELRTLDNDS